MYIIGTSTFICEEQEIELCRAALTCLGPWATRLMGPSWEGYRVCAVILCTSSGFLAYFFTPNPDIQIFFVQVHIAPYIQGGPAKVRPTYIFDGNI